METIATKIFQDTYTNEKVQKVKQITMDVDNGLRELFKKELNNIYSLETELMKAIPKMLSKIKSKKLTLILSGCLKSTGSNIKRLEKVFTIMDAKRDSHQGNLKSGERMEVNDIIEKIECEVECDSRLILEIKKVKYYEMATYGTLAAIANGLSEVSAANLLVEILLEEKVADKELFDIAKKKLCKHRGNSVDAYSKIYKNKQTI